MEVDIKVPHLGEGSGEATFTVWLKAVGQSVRAREPIAEIMTEKVNLEVESPADGVLQAQTAQADDTVAQGATIGTVRTP